MSTAYIALGSNLDSEYGGPAQTLSAAVEHLQALGTVVARSSLYQTEPVGLRNQPEFLNAVVVLETDLAPLALLQGLLATERAFGRDRDRSVPKGPRTLDLDLLMVGDQMLHSEELLLPHPELTRRRFVLTPLAEVAGGVRPPGSGQTVAELLAALPDEGENCRGAVRRLEVW